MRSYTRASPEINNNNNLHFKSNVTKVATFYTDWSQKRAFWKNWYKIKGIPANTLCQPRQPWICFQPAERPPPPAHYDHRQMTIYIYILYCWFAYKNNMQSLPHYIYGAPVFISTNKKWQMMATDRGPGAPVLTGTIYYTWAAWGGLEPLITTIERLEIEIFCSFADGRCMRSEQWVRVYQYSTLYATTTNVSKCFLGRILSISTKLCAVLCSYIPGLTFCQHLKPYFAVISSKSSRKLLNRATNSKHSIAFHEAFTFQVSNTQTASRSRRDSRLLEIAKSEWTSVFELKCNDVTGEYLLLLASFSWREMARNLNARFSLVAGNDVMGEYLLPRPVIAHTFTFCCHKLILRHTTSRKCVAKWREPWLSLTVSFFAHIPRIFRRYITVFRA